MKYNSLFCVVLFLILPSILYSQNSDSTAAYTQLGDSTRMFQSTYADSCEIFDANARENAEFGDFTFALKNAGDALRYRVNKIKIADHSTNAKILQTASLDLAIHLARYFATIYFCSECRDGNDPIIPKLRTALRAINEKASPNAFADQWHYLFLSTYSNEYRSYEETNNMFCAALCIDTLPFKDAFAMAEKRVGVR